MAALALLRFSSYYRMAVAKSGFGGKGAQAAWGTEVPQRSPGAQPLVRGSGDEVPESSQHITDIWLLNHAQFCAFSQTARAACKA